MAEEFQPYYAVIFTSVLREEHEGYYEMAIEMEMLAKNQPGFIGLDSVREQKGITISYWSSLEAIKNWKQQARHQVAQKMGIEKWYKFYDIKICKVEREYSFNSP
ncbi:MAG: antibiotic biosynthesis monooxygenase [Flavobacteriaceae bacterium]|nr:antibiotic biosynthesis monooxygenase [Flavobacteriaceae bacterium]